MRREAVEPRVGERRAGASLARRDPDRPVTPAISFRSRKNETVCGILISE